MRQYRIWRGTRDEGFSKAVLRELLGRKENPVPVVSEFEQRQEKVRAILAGKKSDLIMSVPNEEQAKAWKMEPVEGA